MAIVKLKRTPLNMYRPIESQSKELGILTAFLINECWSSTPHYIEWLKKVKVNGSSMGGYYDLIYENGNITVMRDEDEFDDGFEPKIIFQHTTFITTREHMLEILIAWNRIISLKPRPEEVTLTHDGNKVGFITSNELS